MSNEYFTIFDYSPDNLAICLSNELLSPDNVKSHNHFIYLCDYFDSTSDCMNAKVILLEHEYISRSYLSDYSTYYSLCYYNYPRKCKRLHFFSETFDPDTFLKALIDKDDQYQNIWNSYIGFIVAKPLPEAVIGPTILRTYNEDTGNPNSIRKFTAKYRYDINIFGKKITIDSLAYQEQDTVLSACATTALWSAFYRTSSLFHTNIPSPSEITKSAGTLYLTSGRVFPNHGLDLYQICKSIESIGLVSELRNNDRIKKDMQYFKAFVYSYLKVGLPVLLGINIENRGLHMVTLVGYRENKSIARPSKEISLLGEHIDKFYSHDDQIGPFSRLTCLSNNLETSWWDPKDIKKKLKANVDAVIIPLHPKIRITFEDIYSKVNYIDYFFYKAGFYKKDIIWDIFLDFSNSYKEEILNSSFIDDNLKKKIILKNMPKYIWRARALLNDIILMEVIFDATDIKRGFYGYDIHFYDSTLKTVLITLFNSRKDIQDYFRENLGNDILELILNELGASRIN